MEYREALSFLDRFVDFERRGPSEYEIKTAYLDRMREAVEACGRPIDSYPSIHVGGTKGKGSVCLLLEQFLEGPGLTTGVYTSPHLRTVRERIRIGGAPVSEDLFARGVERLKKKLMDTEEEDRKEVHGKLTYFEWLTLLAMDLFSGESVDAGVFEVGMGGRLDSTNVLSPEVVCLTRIGLDHTEHLGETLSEIAREKAGIIKEDVPVVTSARKGEGREEIRTRAEACGAPLFVLGEDFYVHRREVASGSGTGQRIEIETSQKDRLGLHFPLPGAHQAENLAVALQALRLFSKEERSYLWDPGVIGSISRQMSLPARFQLLERRPPIILDAAHNPISARALATSIEESGIGEPRHLLFGCASDKDWKEMLRVLVPLFDEITLTRFSSDRCASPERIRDFFETLDFGGKVQIQRDPGTFVGEYRNRDRGSPPLIIAGSFYLAGEILEEVKV